MPKAGEIPHVKRVRAKGRDYYYYDTGELKPNGAKIYKRLPDIKAPDFGAKLAAHEAWRTKRAASKPVGLTVNDLVRFYHNSPEFARLAESTQRVYLISLRKIEAEMGEAPVDDVTPKDLATFIGDMGNQPGAVNMALSVMSALYKWGRLKHHVDRKTDPIGDHKPIPTGSHEPWPDHVLSAALKSDEPRVKMAVHLLYYTAQRIGDVCKMTWGDVRDGTVAVTQDKTNKRLAIRLHQELRNLLAETPKRGITILTTEHGHPVSPKTIREELKAFAAGYGVKIVPHGLRKNAVIALLEAGCTVAEAASVSGQSFQMVEYYAELRDQRLLSSAAILKWEGRT
jgi:integrase